MRFLKFGLAMLVILSAGLPLRGQSFTNPLRIPTSTLPTRVLEGDLNGDGLPDIVWSEGIGSQAHFHVLLAQPGGGYLPFGVPFPFTGSPLAGYNEADPLCELADINSDKKLDMVCLGTSSLLNTYLGNGDGTFTGPFAVGSAYDNGNPSRPLDLNSDGIPDFVLGGTYGAYIALGDGKGGFTFVQQATSTLSPGYSVVGVERAADVNGDGIPDILESSGPTVDLGMGSGKFAAAQSYGPGSSCTYADVDRDGHLDAICVHAILVDNVDTTGVVQLTVQHGNADGSFNLTPFVTQTYGDNSNQNNGYPTLSAVVGAADVNGDGIVDVFGRSSDGLGVLLGQAGGGFAYPKHFAMEYGNCAASTYIKLADMNGDGRPDLLTCGTTSLLLAYGKADGSFATVPDLEVAKYITSGTIADFNGDGIPDSATTGDTSVEVSLGRGDGTFLPYGSLPNSGYVFGGNYYGGGPILSGDFNGDGKQDLIATGGTPSDTYSQIPLFFAGNGNGTFQGPVTSNLPVFRAGQFGVLDLNRDGKDDVFSISSGTSGSTTLSVYLSNGDGSFRTLSDPLPAGSSTIAINGYASPSQPSFGDFNGDGKADLVYGGNDSLYTLAGNGDGTFAAAGAVLPIPAVAGQQHGGTYSVATGDFDGDGKIDIAAVVGLAQTVASYTYIDEWAAFVFHGNGDGTFGAGQLLETVPYYGEYSVATVQGADLRKEGHPELVATYQAEVHLLHETASGVFDSPTILMTNGLSGIFVGDANGDGLPDLLAPASGSNAVGVLLNLGTGPTVTGTLVVQPNPVLVTQTANATVTLTPPVAGALAGAVVFTVDNGTNVSVALSGNAASYTLPSLSIGTHTILATWAGDTTYPAVSLSTLVTVTGLPTTTAISSSVNPNMASQATAFTAVVTSPNGTIAPTGSVTFAYGGTSVTAPLVASSANSATAVTGPVMLPVGSAVVTASYAGDTVQVGSSASLTQVTTAINDQASLQSTANPATTLQPVTLSFQLTGLIAGFPPAGTVTFADGGVTLGSVRISATGSASLAATFLTAGAHSLTATYADGSLYASAGAALTETVTLLPTTLTLTSSTNPSTAQQPVTFTMTLQAAQSGSAGGTVTLTDGAATLGTAPVALGGTVSITTGALTAGTHLIGATFAATATLGGSTATPVSQVVNRAASTTTLTVTPSPAYQGTTVVLSATVNVGVAYTPTGSVTFFDGQTPLGTVALTAGAALLRTSALTPGIHALQAIYAGDAVATGSSSAVVNEVILPSDFTLAATPSALNLVTGHHTTFTVTATSVGIFADQLQLSTSNLPAHVTVNFTPAKVALAQGGQAVSSVYLDTDDVIGYLSQVRSQERRWSGTGALAMAAMLPLLLAVRRKRLSAGLRIAALALVLAALMAGASGCSGKYPASTEPGSYTIQIHAVGVQTGTSHILSLPLTVTE